MHERLHGIHAVEDPVLELAQIMIITQSRGDLSFSACGADVAPRFGHVVRDDVDAVDGVVAARGHVERYVADAAACVEDSGAGVAGGGGGEGGGGRGAARDGIGASIRVERRACEAGEELGFHRAERAGDGEGEGGRGLIVAEVAGVVEEEAVANARLEGGVVAL